MSRPQLIVCGSIAIDRIMSFPGRYRELIQPDKLDVLSLSVLVDTLNITPGGNGPNIAYAVAQLGETPLLLGSAGADAADYLQQLSELGVDTSHVHRSQLPTASFTVFTDADNNQVAGFYPGAMADSESVSLEAWAGQDVLFCLSAHDPAAMRRQVEECGRWDIRLVYDPGQQVANVPGEDLSAGVSAAEVVIVNEYELGLLAEKTGRSSAELQSSVPLFITTLGEAGSEITGHTLSQPVKISAASPAKIADPTGAGDAYRAGFLYGYLRQWEARVCAQLGAVLASFVLEQPGTQVAVDKIALAQRYQQTFNEELSL